MYFLKEIVRSFFYESEETGTLLSSDLKPNGTPIWSSNSTLYCLATHTQYFNTKSSINHISTELNLLRAITSKAEDNPPAPLIKKLPPASRCPTCLH